MKIVKKLIGRDLGSKVGSLYTLNGTLPALSQIVLVMRGFLTTFGSTIEVVVWRDPPKSPVLHCSCTQGVLPSPLIRERGFPD